MRLSRWVPPSLRNRQAGGDTGDSMRRREENSVRVTNLSEDTREDDLRVSCHLAFSLGATSPELQSLACGLHILNARHHAWKHIVEYWSCMLIMELLQPLPSEPCDDIKHLQAIKSHEPWTLPTNAIDTRIVSDWAICCAGSLQSLWKHFTHLHCLRQRDRREQRICLCQLCIQVRLQPAAEGLLCPAKRASKFSCICDEVKIMWPATIHQGHGSYPTSPN